jgi:hypothetical protein
MKTTLPTAAVLLSLTAVAGSVHAQCEVNTVGTGPAALDAFGRAMATDLNTLVVGIPGYNAPGAANSGALRVYTRGFMDSWNPGPILTEGVAASAGNAMGSSVDMDLATGTGTIVAGAPIAAVNGLASAGVVRIFEKVNGNWTLTTSLPNPFPNSNDQFGATVSLSGDDLLVGCPGDDAAGVDKGAVYAYRRTANGGWTRIDTLTAPTFNTGCRLGEALDVSGQWAILGVPRYAEPGHTEQGAVLVYRKDATGHWASNATWGTGKPDGTRTGHAVGVRGGWIAYSMPGEQVSATSGVGRVVTYRNDGQIDEGNWALNVPEYAVANEPSVAGFGSSLYVQGGGGILIGATGGTYRAFYFSGDWPFLRIPAPAESGNAAGTSVAASGWTLFMGDPASDAPNMLDAGRVYVHEYDHYNAGNDYCMPWTQITAYPGGTYAGCTTLASVSPTGEVVGQCTNTATSRDVWFKVRANANAPITIDTIGSSFDTVLTLYSTCPSAGGTVLACNDDGAGNFMSRLVIPAQPSTELLVRVGGYNGAHGAFQFNLSRGCGTSDFNGDGDFGTDQDIESFFACLAGSCPFYAGTSDFNGDGDYGTDADIEAFFRVLAGGSC